MGDFLEANCTLHWYHPLGGQKLLVVREAALVGAFRARLRDDGSLRQNVLRWQTRMVAPRSKNEVEGMKKAGRKAA
jgi:hypothetical protein